MELARGIDKEKVNSGGCRQSSCARETPQTLDSFHPLLTLQQQAGNQAVQSLLRQAGIHPKLAIGLPDDPSEREADEIAEQVMRMPAPASSLGIASSTLRRKCAECEEEENKVQLKSSRSASPSAEAPAIVHQVLNTPGQSLDAATRAFFEPRFGADFSQVRLHTDSTAARSAASVDALAYTSGSHIVFAPGRYQPGESDGGRLLAHELAHVVQQNGADASAGAERSIGSAPANIRRESSPPGVIRRVFQGCTDLASNTESISIGEKDVQGPLAAEIPGSVRELPIPTGSFAHSRDKRPDLSGKKSGTGSIDIALTRPPALEILEVKKADFLGLATGLDQLANYLQKGNSDEVADWRAGLGVSTVLPMPPSRFTGSHVRATGSNEPVTVQWCTPGLITYKAIREQDKDIFVCAGRDNGKIDAFLRPKLNQAFAVVDDFIDKTMGPKIEGAVQSMPLGRIIEKMLQNPSLKALLEKALGPGAGVILGAIDGKMLGDLAEQALGQYAPLIRAIALDFIHKVLVQAKQKLHDQMLNILQVELNALCATVAVLTLEDLLKQLSNNLPKYFGEAVAAAIPVVAMQLIQELLKETAIAFAKALAIVAAIVLAIFAIAEIAAALAAAEIMALIDAAIAAILRALQAAGVFALNAVPGVQPAGAGSATPPPTAVAEAGGAGGQSTSTATPSIATPASATA